MQSITNYDRTRNKTLLRRLKNIGMASEKLYRNILNYYYYYYLEEFHWQGGAQLLKNGH